MTITIKTDLQEQSDGVEEMGGVIMGARRSFRADSDSAGDFPTGADDHAVQQVVLDHADMPAPGSTWASFTPSLVLTRRQVRTRNRLRQSGQLTYRYVNNSLNFFTAQTPAVVRPAGALKQVTGDRTPNNTLITVTHNQQTQAAEVSALVLDYGFRIEVQVSTGSPETVVQDWVNKVNDAPWAAWGGRKNTWLCSDATFVPLDTRPSIAQGAWKWIFDFEFRYDKRGWKYEASWRDPVVGRRPEGLTTDVGEKLIDWHDQRNFGVDP